MYATSYSKDKFWESIILTRPEKMKITEILDNNKGLSDTIANELWVRRQTLYNWKTWKTDPKFEYKKDIYELLLDYKLIDPEETSITQLFES